MSARTSTPAGVGLPQVNLLPPEVRAKRGLVRVKRWLAVGLALAVLVAAGGVVMAMLAESAAEAQLAEQQAETDRLVQEQQKYAEVPLLLGQLDQVSAARTFGMSTEVLWPDYLSAIAATAPPGVAIDLLSASAAAPGIPAALPTDALAAVSVANIAFEAESLTLPDTAAWLDGLASIPGFSDAWFSSATVSEEEGLVYYAVSATVQINEQAFAGRFDETEGQS